MMRDVFAAVNQCVEKIQIKAAHANKGHWRAIQRSLLKAIIRSLARDDHVVNVAFAQACRSDADKFCALLQFPNAPRSAIAHAASKAADKLLDQPGKWSFIRHLSFDSFRHGFPAFRAFLCIAVR